VIVSAELVASEALVPQAATGIFEFSWLLVVLPLLSALVLILFGSQLGRLAPWLGVASMVAITVFGLLLFFAMISLPVSDRLIIDSIYEWFAVGEFVVPVALQLDPLSMSFVLLVTIVGTLIHVYSVSYMSHDPNQSRFFAYMNFFVAAMLLLVLADNYLLLYVGWEGVGLASYLLIGFWQYRPSAAAAAKKAFIVNRVGDLGLALSVMVMVFVFGGVTFELIDTEIGSAPSWVPLVLGLLLLLAACGKSAQFPLQSWLLDAMEGPTPVSALIHAATMVTAGVYLVVRSADIYELSNFASNAVLVVALISLLMGAVIGAAKDDIKKVLAGSTMSQIGYMMVAAALGPIGLVFAIFHLITHGFFKSNMFLGAGSVMHALHDEVNMRRYGALRTVMLITFLTFGAGYLAILGVPPFAGFFSKDSIVEAAFSESLFVGALTTLGAGLTGYYMTRLFVMTFFGKPRWPKDSHPHESGPLMTIPMILLALGSVFVGVVLYSGKRFEEWLEPVTGFVEPVLPFPKLWLEVMLISVVFLGAAIAVWQYRSVSATTPEKVSVLTKAARADLYGDKFNESVLMRPGWSLSESLARFDTHGVDGVVNAVGATAKFTSWRLRRLQTGYIRSYAMFVAVSMVVLMGILVLVLQA